MGAPRLEPRVQSRACGRNGPGWAGWLGRAFLSQSNYSS